MLQQILRCAKSAVICGVAARPLPRAKQRLPRLDFRRSIAWLLTSGEEMSCVRDGGSCRGAAAAWTHFIYCELTLIALLSTDTDRYAALESRNR